MLKTKNTVILLTLLLLTVFIFNGCEERKGSLNVPIKPEITITDYFGEENQADLENAELFQQTINWSSFDQDGVVEGYAFRILNVNDDPIPTPGYDYLDNDGWVIHYLNNADESIPIDQSDETTLWIDQTYCTINFPAADENGDSTDVVSKFQVKCIDNDGIESEIAEKYFLAYSAIPSITIQSSKGLIDGETIGLGIIFQFNMLNDPNLPSEATNPYYFEYLLQKVDLDGNIILEADGGYPDTWISTLGQSDIDIATISEESDIQLISSVFKLGVAQDSTKLWVKGVSIAGIKTEPSYITFAVSDKFAPGSIVYYGANAGEKNVIYALGENHYSTYLDAAITVTIPYIQTSSGIHNACPFWIDNEGNYTLIGSQDIKIYMRWGWSGEYENNNPLKRLEENTLDEVTNQPYYSEITHFDIRVDDAPLYYPPLPPTGDNLKIDEDGTEWFRVPVNHNVGKSVTLTTAMLGGLSNLYKEHQFTVRSVDLQGVADPTPDTFTFTIEQHVPFEERSGILIIDDEVPGSNAPADTINYLYNYFVEEFDSDPGYLDRNEIKTNMSNVWGLDQLHFGKAVLSPTELQHFRTIIYHSDNPITDSNFYNEYEVFEIYLNTGGNLIFSAGSVLNNVQTKCRSLGFPLLEQYFGIPLLTEIDHDPILSVSKSFSDKPFFINAISTESETYSIPLQLPSFNISISHPVEMLSKDGLGPVAYFDMDQIDAEVIYTYGSKAPGEDPFPAFHTVPTQEEFDTYNGLPVAIKKTTGNVNCIMFGFPLGYMEKDSTKNMMSLLLNDIGY